jgi:arylsulfatase K
MRSAYWGACAEMLNDMDRVILTAARTGHLDNTIVIFTSDHGEMSMEHRQVRRG